MGPETGDFKLGTGDGDQGLGTGSEDCRLWIGSGTEYWDLVPGSQGTGQDAAAAAFPWGRARGRAGVCGRKEGSRSCGRTEVLAELLLRLGGAPGPRLGKGACDGGNF